LLTILLWRVVAGEGVVKVVYTTQEMVALAVIYLVL
jgi:hypothetical protein